MGKPKITVKVRIYEDDGRWGAYDRWFMRSDEDLHTLNRGVVKTVCHDSEYEEALASCVAVAEGKFHDAILVY